MFNKRKLVIISAFLYFISCMEMQAQCAMCRAVLESEEGGAKAAAVNDGIVYLMAFPYVLVAIVFYVVYKMKFKNNTTDS